MSGGVVVVAGEHRLVNRFTEVLSSHRRAEWLCR